MGLLIFLLLGLTTPALAALNGFHFVEQAKTWSEAQSYCRDKFTDLATIRTQDDWTTVKEKLAKSGHTVAWLGLYDDVKSWRWSLDNTSLYSRDLGTWFPFTEDNIRGDVHCAYIWNGQLYDESCRFAHRSVCYNETTCSYIGVKDPMSWQQAQSYCRERYTDLASIRDQQELNAISNTTNPNFYYWMGLSREGWKWSDQSDFSLTLWAPGQPNGAIEACGAAGVDGWHDAPCGNSYPFICSVSRPVVVRVMVKTHISGNDTNRCELKTLR